VYLAVGGGSLSATFTLRASVKRERVDGQSNVVLFSLLNGLPQVRVRVRVRVRVLRVLRERE
jgi:hypothetical protein